MSVLTSRSAAHSSPVARNADHYVYRCYDVDGDLIYIGCTRNVKSRLAEHSRGTGGSKASKWLSVFMDRYEVEGPYRGRDAGREAEATAIRLEQPLFNTQQRKDCGSWHSRAEVARYLMERGHLELAAETCCRCTPDDEEFGSLCEPHNALEAGAA